MDPALRFIAPETPDDLAAFRRLNWEYRDLLLSLPPEDAAVVTLAYPEAKYRAVLDAIETENRPPRGMMRLVMKDGAPVGCGTVQTFEPGTAEIKRVYIAEAARGTGAGRALMERLIADCRDLGFRRIVMDTGRVLTTAQALYDRLGFVRRGPYQDVPEIAEGRLVFYEMDLG
ncbi:GNAT family N-acetyltransferase [Rhodobacterales bacterium HKCCE3408]|nr:GNAT family N-acetyltransferase [Rhodobacterales bacterium HKCCE3408]